MFKPFSRLLVAAVTIATFQNCAPGMSQLDFGSQGLTSQTVDTDHKDRDHDPRPFREDKIEVSAKDLIADRVLLINQLMSIFGTRVGSLDKDKIAVDLRNFASPCSAHEQYNYLKDGKIVNAGFRTCAISNSAASMRASVYAETSTVRQGLMEHLCRALTADPNARSFALKQVAANGKPAATKDNLLKAFRLFYRSAPRPPDSVLESLQVMIGSEEATPAQWTPVLFTLCVSPGWQVL